MSLKHVFRPAFASVAVAVALVVAPMVASAQTADAMPAPSLGPFLFIFILVGGGIIAAIAVRFADQQIQSDHVRWLADGSRQIFGITPIK